MSGKNITRMITEKQDLSIRSLKGMEEDGDLILNPHYQREYVYDDKRASKVIESILLNMPLGVVYIAEIDGESQVADGRQRLSSILKFVNNEMKLKGLTIFEEFNGLYFDELPQECKKAINNYKLNVINIIECTYEQVYELYERLNCGSVKLNNQEIRRCVYHGKFNDMIEEVVNHPSLDYYIGHMDNIRLQKVELLIFALALAENCKFNNKKSHINKYMEKHRCAEEQTINEIKERIISTFDLIKDVLGDYAFKFIGDENSKFTNVLFYPTVNTFMNGDRELIIKNADNIRNIVKNIKQEDICAFQPNGKILGDKKGIRYNIEQFDYLVNNSLDIDATRKTFLNEWKPELYREQQGICPICEKEINDIGIAQIEYVIPWLRGGETKKENAQLVHNHCGAKIKEI